MFVAICCFIFSFKFYFILILQTEYDSQNRRICMWMKSTYHRCSTLRNTTDCQQSLRRCRCRCLHLNNIKNNTSNHVNTQIAWRKLKKRVIIIINNISENKLESVAALNTIFHLKVFSRYNLLA